jgi:hypothetical protein
MWEASVRNKWAPASTRMAMPVVSPHGDAQGLPTAAGSGSMSIVAAATDLHVGKTSGYYTTAFRTLQARNNVRNRHPRTETLH